MRNPWVGLRPFTPDEGDLFFGRARETQIVSNLVFTLPVLVVYARSGTGKSSLINAGLAPQLRQDRSCELVVVRDARDDVLGETRGRLQAAGWAGPEDLGLADLIERHWLDTDRRTIVVVDQFEERLNAGVPVDELFAAAATMGNSGTDAGCLVFTIREDYLGNLEPLMRRVPGLLNGSYRVPALTRGALELAVYGPLEAAGDAGSVDPTLVTRSLDDLDQQATLRQEPSEQRFEPGYFQIVWSRLWEHHAATSANGEPVLSLSGYEELGGAGQILKDFTSATLTSLEPVHAEMFWAISRYLVLPTGAKIALTVDDVAELLQVTDYLSDMHGYARETWLYGLTDRERRELIRRVLAQLTSSRAPLFQRVIRSDREEFELLHDLLGKILLTWRAEYQTVRQSQRGNVLAAVDREERRLAETLSRRRLVHRHDTREVRELIVHAIAVARAYRTSGDDRQRTIDPERPSDDALELMALRGLIADLAGRSGLLRFDVADEVNTFEEEWRQLVRLGLDDPSESVRLHAQELLPLWRPEDLQRSREPGVYVPPKPFQAVAMVVGSVALAAGAAAIAYFLLRGIPIGRDLRYTGLTLGNVALFAALIYGLALSEAEPRIRAVVPVVRRSGRWRLPWISVPSALLMTWPLPVVLVALGGVGGGWLFDAIGLEPVAGFNLAVLYASGAVATVYAIAVDL